MDEEDIYGEDIYGGSHVAELSARDQGAQESQYGSNGAEDLQRQLADRDSQITRLEAELKVSLSTVGQWQQAFGAACGNADLKSVDPITAGAEMKQWYSSNDKGQMDTAAVSKQKEAALQLQLAERNLENLALRQQAHDSNQQTRPPIAQVEQLILDVAVQRQFDQTKRELEVMALETKSLQEELQAVQFSQDSKAGRMLMAKCRALQDENEEMGKELAEGKVHSLERQIALSRAYAEDIRARYLELEDHLHALDMENESLHQQVFLLKKQLRESEARFVPGPRDRGMKPMIGRGMGPLPGPPGGGNPGRDPGMDRMGGFKRMR